MIALLGQIILIVQETEKSLRPIVSYKEELEKLDGVLDASLAATLAGLSLAALALFLSVSTPVKEKITKLKGDQDETRSDKYRSAIKEEIFLIEKKLVLINESIVAMYKSFIFFLLFLLETLTLDIVAEKNICFMDIPYTLPADLLLSGGFILGGIVFMWISANKMKSIISFES